MNELNDIVNQQIESHEDRIKRLKDIVLKSHIDLDKPPALPPICLKIGDKGGFNKYYKRRLLTLGNISAITGKGKSKKTFLTSLISAAFVKNNDCQNKFFSELPENKRGVIRIDTEQSEYDAFKAGRVVKDLCGGFDTTYTVFNLREYEHVIRIEFIEYILEQHGHDTGVIIIDGIADLVSNINDIEECNKVVQSLLTWSKIYNIHIITVVHQNKDNNYATGHLGSSLIKKVEVVISVTKQGDVSDVSCDNIRGAAEFQSFSFSITDDGIPEIIDNEQSDNFETKDVSF